MKIEGSGSASGSRSISQMHRSADPDPDPHQMSWIRNTAKNIRIRRIRIRNTAVNRTELFANTYRQFTEIRLCLCAG
jgi:hypothetical protein